MKYKSSISIFGLSALILVNGCLLSLLDGAAFGFFSYFLGRVGYLFCGLGIVNLMVEVFKDIMQLFSSVKKFSDTDSDSSSDSNSDSNSDSSSGSSSDKG